MIGFHLGTQKNFKHYYNQMIRTHYKSLFPSLVTYHRFIELQQKCAVSFMLFLKHCCLGECRGINFIDSTSLKVCNNKRIHKHKVFLQTASRGKTSMGWFFEFKLHLIINEKKNL